MEQLRGKATQSTSPPMDPFKILGCEVQGLCGGRPVGIVFAGPVQKA